MEIAEKEESERIRIFKEQKESHRSSKLEKLKSCHQATLGRKRKDEEELIWELGSSSQEGSNGASLLDGN